MVYEKHRVTAEFPEEGDNSCSFCDRPTLGVRCTGCLQHFPKVRARRSCAQHPNKFFLMDLPKCPNCKGSELIEGAASFDQMDSRQAGSSKGLVSQVQVPPRGVAMDLDLSVARASVAGPSSRPAPAALAPRPQVPLLPVAAPLMPEVRAASIAQPAGLAPAALPMGSNGRVQNAARVENGLPTKNCVCNRAVGYILCSNCAFFESGPNARKRIPCPAHPQTQVGYEKCPSCNTNSLEEENITDD